MTPVICRKLAAAAVLACAPLAAVTSATAAPVAAAPTAAVDECAELDLDDAAQIRELADDADAVFVGRVRRVSVVKGPPDAGPDRDPAGWKHQATVIVGLRGEPGPGDGVVVRTKAAEAGQTPDQMGLGKLAPDSTYLFFVTERGTTGEFVAGACDGTTRIRNGLGAALERQLKRALAEPTEEPGLDVTFSEPPGGTEATPALSRMVAPGIAVSLVGLLGLVLVSRLNARRP